MGRETWPTLLAALGARPCPSLLSKCVEAQGKAGPQGGWGQSWEEGLSGAPGGLSLCI